MGTRIRDIENDGAKIPGYRIARELGRGGMATVYEAEDLKHRRRVALKVIRPDVAETIGRSRFLREIEVTANFSHPHILPLFDSGDAAGRLFYVMPLVAGETLRAHLDRERPLPIEDAVRLTREIASALTYAHQHGTVHRDIKPENILLSAGIGLLADFGIAHSIALAAETDFASTRLGTLLGTPGYMSPEQISGEPVDRRTDVYALACVLFDLLTGQPPFAAATADALLRMHLVATPQPVMALRPSVSAPLGAVVAKALAKARSDRFESAARFAEAIAAAMTTSAAPVAGERAADVPHNLPRLRTPVIGRQRELEECSRLIESTQLLTITGVGGCGKTRLAMQLAERLLARFPDGVWFADLAPLAHGERVADAVRASLGIPEVPGKASTATLREGVCGKRVLIVLDNCEHVLRGRVARERAVVGRRHPHACNQPRRARQ